MRSPASKPAIKGPASYNKVCCAVFIQTACPCPTSNSQTCACPCSTEISSGLSNGTQKPTTTSKGIIGRGNSSDTTPSKANNNTQMLAPPPVQTASLCANHCNTLNITSNSQPATFKTTAANSGHANKQAPNKVIGSASKLSQGTANKLANGPTRLTGKLNANRNGAKPIAATHCVRVSTCHQRQAPKRPAKAKINAATAAKDSQKPACNTTKGSYSKTKHKAAKKAVQALKC